MNMGPVILLDRDVEEQTLVTPVRASGVKTPGLREVLPWVQFVVFFLWPRTAMASVLGTLDSLVGRQFSQNYS